MCVAGWWEGCCSDQSKQMDLGPCGTQIHAPGLLTRRITLQPYRVQHWFSFFSLHFFCPPLSPSLLLLLPSPASFHLGPGWNNHRFPFLAYGFLRQQIWTGEWHQTVAALYQQKRINIKRREWGSALGNGHWAVDRFHFALSLYTDTAELDVQIIVSFFNRSNEAWQVFARFLQLSELCMAGRGSAGRAHNSCTQAVYWHILSVPFPLRNTTLLV